MEKYIPLHNHTEYSLLDGFSSPEDYMKICSELGLPALAITEHGNIYSMPYLEKLKKKYPQVKVIYGMEAYECFDMDLKDKDSKYFHLVLLCKNENARININKLITESNFRGKYFKPRLDLKTIEPYGKDFIALSACLAGKIAREKDYSKCLEYVNEYKSIFGDFYLEMQSHESEEQCEYNKKILKLSVDTNTKFVITTDSHASTKEKLYYQNKFVQIAKDMETASEIYDGCYIQTSEEIHRIMDNQIGRENVSIGLANTLEVGDKIEDVIFPFIEPKLPHFNLPNGFSSENEYFKSLINLGIKERRINFDETAKKRIKYEYEIITSMNFTGYFLILQDVIKWCKKNNVIVGAGRGSAGGSIICYLLGITDVNPIKYNLVFERFLNPERISMPDIDTDLSDRKKAIDYITQKYGADSVCQVLNFSYITAKVAIDDTARVLGIDYKKSKEISAFFIDRDFEKNNYPAHYEKEYPELFDIAKNLSGKIRQVSMHAGAVCISDGQLYNYMGCVQGGDGEIVISCDKRIVEEIGLVKYDLLGLETLNIIGDTLKQIGKDFDYIHPDNENMLNDTNAYELLSSGNTNGVFQVEGAGMKDLLRQIKPSNVSEISDVISLYRPDAMPYIPDYIKNKENRDNISYIHEDYAEILDKNYGVMIYQETLMEIVRKFGGRTYGGADKFRKAIGKKDLELVKKESEQLYYDIVKTGYDENLAKIISEELKEKGNYLFNLSHGIEYGVITLQTAFLKANHTLEYMCSILNSVQPNKISKIINDCVKNNIVVSTPNINKSELKFSVKDGKILFGLSAIKGLGEDVCLRIIENAPYKNFTDLLGRANFLDKGQIVALIKSGALGKNKKGLIKAYFDKIKTTREFKARTTVPSPKDALKFGIVEKNTKLRLELFNQMAEKEFLLKLEETQKLEMQEFLEKYYTNEELWEFESLNMFVTKNPFEELDTKFYCDFEDGDTCTIPCIITKTKNKKTKKGNQYMEISIFDGDDVFDIKAWSNIIKKNAEILKTGKMIVILGRKEENSISVSNIKDYFAWKKETGR